MKKNASRMKVRQTHRPIYTISLARITQVLSVQDLSAEDAAKSLRFLRASVGPNHGFVSKLDREQIPEVLKLTGGRTSFLSRVARAPDMLGKCLLGLFPPYLLTISVRGSTEYG